MQIYNKKDFIKALVDPQQWESLNFQYDEYENDWQDLLDNGLRYPFSEFSGSFVDAVHEAIQNEDPSIAMHIVSGIFFGNFININSYTWNEQSRNIQAAWGEALATAANNAKSFDVDYNGKIININELNIDDFIEAIKEPLERVLVEKNVSENKKNRILSARDETIEAYNNKNFTRFKIGTKYFFTLIGFLTVILNFSEELIKIINN